MARSRHWAAGYACRSFRDARQPSARIRRDTEGLRDLETRVVSHPVTAGTVVIPNFNRVRDYAEVRALVRAHRLRQISAGPHLCGFALNLANADQARLFQRVFPKQSFTAAVLEIISGLAEKELN